MSCARRATERHEARGRCYRLYRHFVYREVGVEEWPRKVSGQRIAEMLSFLTQSRNRSSHSEYDPVRTEDTELVVTVPVVVTCA